jgi:hypothetical protein
MVGASFPDLFPRSGNADNVRSEVYQPPEWRRPAVTVSLDEPLALEVEPFLEAQGEALRRPELRRVASWAVDVAKSLIRPALVHDWFPVTADGAQVRVGGMELHLGRHRELLDRAQEALVGVATIGAALEQEARRLGQEGRTLEAFLLGEAGVFAVGLLAKRLHAVAEEEAARRGWGVGAELAPGQLAGWDVREQKLLCGLLDLGSIGVEVTPTGLLVPEKSVSLLVGIGPAYESTRVESPCRYCSQGTTCRYRH